MDSEVRVTFRMALSTICLPCSEYLFLAFSNLNQPLSSMAKAGMPGYSPGSWRKTYESNATTTAPATSWP